MPIDRLDDLVDALPIGFALLDRQLVIRRVNAAFTDLLGIVQTLCTGQKLDDLAPTFAVHVRDLAHRAWRSERPLRKTFLEAAGTRGSDAVPRNWSVTVARRADSLCCFVSELSAAPVADADTHHKIQDRLKFEGFLAKLSAEFVAAPPQSVDAQIREGLKQLVEFLGVGRATVVSAVSPDGTAIVLGSYAVPGMTVLPEGEPFNELRAMKWYTGELINGRTVHLRSIDDLPPSAKYERQYFQSAGIQSQLGIPFQIAGLPLCVLEIASLRTTQLLVSELIPRLRIVGEVFANAIARRNADRDLRRIHSELAHVARTSTVGQLATSIAHEISQPLTAILSNAHAAIRGLSKANPDLNVALAGLRDIVADDKRAVAIVSNAHAMLKRREVEFSDEPINDIVRAVVLLLHGDALMRRIHLRTQLAPTAPTVKGDRVQLQQVVMNLVVNAMDSLEHTKRGPREIILTTEAVDDVVHVAVRDTGIGLAPPVLARMFEPYFTTRTQGLGMGLAITKAIVSGHGGHMSAADNDGPGATVGFNLPKTQTASKTKR